MTDSDADSLAQSNVDRRRLVRDGYDHLAETYAAERDQDEGERQLLRELLDRIDDAEPTVLDAGCGDGTAATRPLAEAGADVVGLDVSRAQLELASRGGGAAATLAQGDLTALPFEPETFDAVCAFHSVIHVPRDEHETVFAEFERVLRPNGWLLVTLGEGAWEGSNPDWLDGGAEMSWSFHDIDRSKDALDAAGFSVENEWTLDDELGGGQWRYVLARCR
ncbi:class I SAM-dependent methyltransferase [Halovivax gelatinilyticus]|uniref:class I SAM-dependent methyltransferase n=1 Tax=Halovivax gelatinilyticus TaxID=2961597 RepID=UPI0020CA513B|nr:class I SAM-dependent methyltransferase [Halovivax gelatinilyticus]